MCIYGEWGHRWKERNARVYKYTDIDLFVDTTTKTGNSLFTIEWKLVWFISQGTPVSLQCLCQGSHYDADDN